MGEHGQHTRHPQGTLGVHGGDPSGRDGAPHQDRLDETVGGELGGVPRGAAHLRGAVDAGGRSTDRRRRADADLCVRHSYRPATIVSARATVRRASSTL